MTFYSKNFDIYYTKDDLDYIPEIINFLTERIPELTNFFKLENLDTKDKPQIILYNDYNQFRNDCVIYNIGNIMFGHVCRRGEPLWLLLMKSHWKRSSRPLI